MARIYISTILIATWNKDDLLTTDQEHHKKAFEQYYALGEKRSYQHVARELGVSPSTVKLWSRSFNWRRRIQERDAQLARQVADRAIKSGIEEHDRNRKIVQMALMKLAKAIAEGKVRMQLGDLDRLLRLEADLGGTPGQPTVPSGPLTAEQLADMIEEYNFAPKHIQKEAHRIFEQRYAPRTQQGVSTSGREEPSS